MKVGFVKSIAALLVGTGVALGQSPTPGSGKMTPRGTVIPSLADTSYPATSGQQGYDSEHHSVDQSGLNWDGDPGASSGFYADVEYLLWNVRNPSLPSLATSIPVGLVIVNQRDTFTGPGAAAITPNPVVSPFSIPFSVTSSPTFPNSNSISMGEHNGARLTAGYWCDSDHDLGVEVRGFWLEKLSEPFSSTTANSSNQFNLQTGVSDRTFFVPAGMAAAQLLPSQGITVFPAQSTSKVTGTFANELWGAELNLRSSGYRVGGFTFGGLAGVRYLHFEDTLTFANDVRVTDAPQSPVRAPFLPIALTTFDRIKTHNEIFAPQLGVEVEAQCYGFFVNGRGTVAVGPNFQEVNVQGQTTVVGGSNPLTNAPGGLLSGPANQGDHSRTRVTFIPEFNAKLGYQCGSWLRVHVGYDALSIEHTARPAQQIAFNNLATSVTVAGSTNQVNVTQPTINLHDSDTWIQGLNFGMEFRY